MALRELVFCDTSNALAKALSTHVPRPTAVVGVGNPLRGDDGFGPAVARAVPACDNLFPFDVQGVPESFLVPIVQTGCRGVLFVDAAALGTQPGRVALVPAARLTDVDVSTHAVALALVAEAIQELAREADGRDVACALVGAEPASLETPDTLSPAAEAAVRLAAAGIRAFGSA